MNASMNDTHNLGLCCRPHLFVHRLINRAPTAWKLAYVLRGWADMSLLKTVRNDITNLFAVPETIPRRFSTSLNVGSTPRT
jgi:hypothetical protein